MARRLEQALVERRADVARRRDRDLLALAGRAVDDGDGLGAGGGRGVARPGRRDWRRTGRSGPARPAVMLRGPCGRRRWRRAWPAGFGASKPVATTAIGSPPSGSSTNSAQTPQASDEQPERAAIDPRNADREREARRFFLAFGRAECSGHRPPRPQALANHARQPRRRIVNPSFTEDCQTAPACQKQTGRPWAAPRRFGYAEVT